MVKFVILLGLVLLTEINGIPTDVVNPDDSSAGEKPRVKEWITFNPSWSFPSLPSVSSLFHDTEQEDSAMKLIKKRLENLEKSQKSIVELLKRITRGGANSPCNTDKDTQNEKPIVPTKPLEINNEKKEPVKPTSSLTSSVSTTIDHLPVEDSTFPLKDTQVETTVPVTSEKPITNTTSVTDVQSATPSEKDSDEIVQKPSNAVTPSDSQTSTTESVKLDDESNSTTLPNSETSVASVESAELLETARVNTRLLWNRESRAENL